LARSAAEGFDAAGMTLYSAAASWRHGRLCNDGAVMTAARERFESQGIRAPRRWIDMLAPGFASTATAAGRNSR
jgi:hypothetical protein